MVQIEHAEKMQQLSPEQQEQYWQSVDPQMRAAFEGAIVEQGITMPGLAISPAAQAALVSGVVVACEGRGATDCLPPPPPPPRQDEQEARALQEQQPQEGGGVMMGSKAADHARAQADNQLAAVHHFAPFRAMSPEEQGAAWAAMSPEEQQAYSGMVNIELADKLKVSGGEGSGGEGGEGASWPLLTLN